MQAFSAFMRPACCPLHKLTPLLLFTAVNEVAEDSASASSAAAAADVQAALVKRVLPALSEQLIIKNEVR